MNIDKRLQEILTDTAESICGEWCIGDHLGAEAVQAHMAKEIAAIQQAYKDVGYAQDTYTGSGKAYTTDHKELMTGQEWFDRLITETKLLDEEEIHKAYAIINAAKRASGIKEDSQVIFHPGITIEQIKSAKIQNER